MKVSIIGATGYTGFELVKILMRHPRVELSMLTSETYAGKRMCDVYPALRGACELLLCPNDLEEVARASDAVFLCLPHGASMEAAAHLRQKGVIVLDLSADFRVNDQSLYESTYKTAHVAPNLLSEAVYGLAEIFTDEIKNASLVAVPGCYPTSIITPLYPLFEENLVKPGAVIADSKSGVSGAGRKATETTHYVEVNEDFKAYGIFGHRHNAEIDHILDRTGNAHHVIFTPHLLPVSRGILSTIYFSTDADRAALVSALEKRYAGRPFVRILPEGEPSSIKNVAHTNFIDISVFMKDGAAIVTSAIDNLVKGASGQAVQDMNLIAGFAETDGLR